ncbi:MAG TPA: sodium dependent phosphate transporter [Actinobacteria bacterium]|nr:sodium dependent phosphate transporter [Actinomycetota bacterium]
MVSSSKRTRRRKSCCARSRSAPASSSKRSSTTRRFASRTIPGISYRDVESTRTSAENSDGIVWPAVEGEVTIGFRDRGTKWVQAALVLFLLYVFLVGVKALESGIKAFGADFTDRLFQEVSHPIAGLFVGILATVLVQSSSVTTSTIVGLVGSGMLTVPLAVPMVMGANIGTTVTNTLASLGFLRRSQEFRRAFAGATMHDFFNLLAVAVFLPLELTTHFLSRSATALAGLLGASTTLQFEKPDSPIKTAVKAPVKLIDAALQSTGAHQAVLGTLLLIIGIALIFIALAFITRTMKQLMAGRIERSMNAVLSRGGGIAAIMVGLVMTVAVQSSSITTSLLVPMIAAGVLTLENGFPVTLGANVGTTATALLAALAADRPEGLVIALTHTLFNVGGILVFYPVPAIRRIPLWLARKLAAFAEIRKSAVLVYVVGVFVVLPLIGLLLLD